MCADCAYCDETIINANSKHKSSSHLVNDVVTSWPDWSGMFWLQWCISFLPIVLFSLLQQWQLKSPSQQHCRHTPLSLVTCQKQRADDGNLLAFKISQRIANDAFSQSCFRIKEEVASPASSNLYLVQDFLIHWWASPPSWTHSPEGGLCLQLVAHRSGLEARFTCNWAPSKQRVNHWIAPQLVDTAWYNLEAAIRDLHSCVRNKAGKATWWAPRGTKQSCYCCCCCC